MRRPSQRPDAGTIVIRLSTRRGGRGGRLATGLLGLFAGLAAVVLLLLVAAVASAYIYYQNAGRILPGVRAGAVQLDGMTVNEAAVTLEKTWGLETRIRVDSGLHSQELSPAELGLKIDAYLTARRAYEAGHIGSPIARAAQIFASLKDGWQVTPAVSLDEKVARARLEALAPEMSQPAKDATIQMASDGLAPVPPEIGYTVNLDATLAALQADPQSVLVNGRLPVTLKPVLPAVNDVSTVLAAAQRLLNTPFTLITYDPVQDESQSWQPPRQTLAGWLTVTPGQGGPRLSLDPVSVSAYLDQISGKLGDGRYLDVSRAAPQVVDAFLQGRQPLVPVRHRPTIYTVQSGDTLLKIGWNLGIPFWRIQRANPELDPDKMTAGMTLTIPSRDDLLPLPIVPGKRIEISISKQRMRIFQNGALIEQYVISTGIDRSPTQPGVFQIQTHDPNAYASVWDLYMPNFLGIYEAWPGFMNGIHGLPTLSSGQRLWANILGSPASYGCIILDLPAADWLYNWAEDGVVVEIKP